MKRINLLPFGLALFLAASVNAQDNHPTKASSAASEAAKVTFDSGSEATSEVRTDQPVLKRRNPRYQLRSGDVIELTFTFTPEFNQTVTIQPDGYITIREVGDVHVQGKTAPELTGTIRAAYSKILHNPIISIVLRDFERPYFIAAGEVKRPGKYELRGDTTIAEAVAIAGGFTDASKHSQVFLFRRVSVDSVEVKKLDLKKMLRNANLSEDAHLQPGDMFYVPQNTLSKVKGFVIPRATVGPTIRPQP